MTSQVNSGKKNLFCRETYWKLINNYCGEEVFTSFHGARLRNCSYGDKCRGAHSEDEINTLPHIDAFNKMDKSKINLISIYENIISAFNKDKSKVINKELKDKLEKFTDLNLVELMNLWYEVTCYHRKIKKEMKIDSNFKSEFKSINSIPDFELDNEDLVWSLERITKMCPVNKELFRKICCPVEKPNIWDMCLASINCKLGCHNISNMLCTEDLLKGTCSCMPLDEFQNKKNTISLQIKTLKEQLLDNGLNYKKKKNIQKKINTLVSENNNMIRKLHFTENGLIPFSKQYEEFNSRKEEGVRKENERKEGLKTSVKKKISKPILS